LDSLKGLLCPLYASTCFNRDHSTTGILTGQNIAIFWKGRICPRRPLSRANHFPEGKHGSSAGFNASYSAESKDTSTVRISRCAAAFVEQHYLADFAAGPITLNAIAVVLLFIGILTFIDPSVKLRHPKNLALVIPIVIFTAVIVGFFLWRAGSIVAAATFNPGIAPFNITVREVPVPVTRSHHFIITLKRGQYPVTSFRYFWVSYTPKSVRIEWTRLEIFKVIFDERYVATCNWSWGREATWMMQAPPGAQMPGDQP
jgi:hypothetical protein